MYLFIHSFVFVVIISFPCLLLERILPKRYLDAEAGVLIEWSSHLLLELINYFLCSHDIEHCVIKNAEKAHKRYGETLKWREENNVICVFFDTVLLTTIFSTRIVWFIC